MTDVGLCSPQEHGSQAHGTHGRQKHVQPEQQEHRPDQEGL